MPTAQLQTHPPDPATETDLALLRRYASHRDASAFAEIVRRYGSVVYATGRRVLHDRAAAEDVTQETFLRLMRSPDRCTQSLGGWLHRLATRLAVDALRSERSRRRRELSYESPADDDDARPGDAPDLLAWRELSPRIDEALDELPAEARELLVAHFLRGRTQTELAKETGTSPATLCRRMKDAIELLRRELSRRGVQVSAPCLAFLCLRHGATEAAPATVTLELGKMAMVSGGPMGGAGGTVFVPAAAASAKATAASSWTQFFRAAIETAASGLPAARTMAILLLSTAAVGASPWAVSKGWEVLSVLGARHEESAPARHHVERHEERRLPEGTHTRRSVPGAYGQVAA